MVIKEKDKMSRMYELDAEITKTEINGAEFKKILTIFEQEWTKGINGIIMHDKNGSDIAVFDGEGVLCGGESEFGAHSRIKNAIKKEISNCSIKTRWTYLEELPYEEYID